MSVNSSTEYKTAKSKTFPKIMISKKTEIIVLFESNKKGVVIGNPKSGYPIGCHDEFWKPDYFIDYDGPITLQNNS